MFPKVDVGIMHPHMLLVFDRCSFQASIGLPTSMKYVVSLLSHRRRTQG